MDSASLAAARSPGPWRQYPSSPEGWGVKRWSSMRVCVQCCRTNFQEWNLHSTRYLWAYLTGTNGLVMKQYMWYPQHHKRGLCIWCNPWYSLVSESVFCYWFAHYNFMARVNQWLFVINHLWIIVLSWIYTHNIHMALIWTCTKHIIGLFVCKYELPEHGVLHLCFFATAAMNIIVCWSCLNNGSFPWHFSVNLLKSWYISIAELNRSVSPL